jgi:hypothetical protein
MSNATDPNEQSGSPRNTRNPGLNSGLNVTSQVEVGAIKPTDAKTLEGSYPGDSRGQAADAQLPSNPAPRGETGQAGA